MTKWRILYHFMTVGAFAIAAVLLLLFTDQVAAGVVDLAHLLEEVTR